jgi:hypothetical protein
MTYNAIPFDVTSRDSGEMAKPVKGPAMTRPDKFGYEYVRYGDLTEIAIDHKSVQEDIDTLLDYYNAHGYSDCIPRLKNPEFKKSVLKFRATLDAWELIPISKVFSKDELYYRCLDEGPQFTEFIKKCRSTTLRGLTSLTETDIEEEYFTPVNYSGYDSICHERNLIHWDDRDTIDDVKYAFMSLSDETHNFEEFFSKFLDSIPVNGDDFDLDMDIFGELKNTKMYDPKTKKTNLMREYWLDDIQIAEPYLAKRSIVLTEPGSTRDTGVGDPSTIAKVKMINSIIRTILERCMYSASAPAKSATNRLMRVLERNVYLHLDFKKYGLAFNRNLQNIALRIIGKKYRIDVENLLLLDFFIDIDGEIFKTTRGSMLGWLDCLNELIVHSILWDLKKDLKFDWIGFNDDFEISFFAPKRDERTKSEMMRDAILIALNRFDLLISINKTYASKGSLFLEKYFRFEENYNLDMTKRQLACKSYARSLIELEPWLAKVHFATAYSVWPNEELADRCISTCPIEFKEAEQFRSLLCGGWYPSTSNQKDTSLDNQGIEFLNLYVELTKIDIPDISTKPVKVSSASEINMTKQKRLRSYKDEDDGKFKFSFFDIPYDVNYEASGVIAMSHVRLSHYHGKDINFVSSWNSLMARYNGQGGSSCYE